MKKTLLFLIAFLFAITLGKAQHISDGYLWVAVADPSALPVSSNQTANDELNIIFEEFQVTNYFYRFDFPFCPNYDSIENLQIYEIHYEHITDNPDINDYSENNFYTELELTGLFSYVFNFYININDPKLLLAFFSDTSALPALDNLHSNNDVVNAVLDQFDITSYEVPSYPDLYPPNTVMITCGSCDIVELCMQLSTLDAVFAGFYVEQLGYPDLIPEFDLQDIKIYPNPFSNNLIIEHDAIQNIEIYNMQGMLVYSQFDGSFDNLNLSFLSTGLYILKIQTTENKIVYNKIMKAGKF